MICTDYKFMRQLYLTLNTTQQETNLDSTELLSQKPEATIQIDGIWYDITEFVKRHPGGSVIQSYNGQDASLVYHEMHRRSKKADLILKSLPKCKKNPDSSTEQNQDVDDIENESDSEGSVIIQKRSDKERMLQDFREWTESLEFRGFFEPDMEHSFYRILELIGIFSMATWCMSIDGILPKMFGILLYGLFGGRCGWVQHEAGHRSLTGDIYTDDIIQKVVMGFGLLTNGLMWNSMHNRHHATTQKLGHDIDLDTMPFVLFHEDAMIPKKLASALWLKYQAYTFLPVTSGLLVMLFWITYLHPRKVIRDKDWFTGSTMISGHVIRTLIIQKQTGYSFLASYGLLLASMYVSGIYLFGHFSTSHSFLPVIASDENPSWVEYSLGHTVDIETQNPVVSWVMGYLNCQCVHHLFPQMPQYRQPEVSRELALFAKKWDLPYQQIGYWEAWRLTFQNLDRIGNQVYERYNPVRVQSVSITRTKENTVKEKFD